MDRKSPKRGRALRWLLLSLLVSLVALSLYSRRDGRAREGPRALPWRDKWATLRDEQELLEDCDDVDGFLDDVLRSRGRVVEGP